MHPFQRDILKVSRPVPLNPRNGWIYTPHEPATLKAPAALAVYVHARTRRTQHLTINAQNSNEQFHAVNYAANIEREYAEISLTVRHYNSEMHWKLITTVDISHFHTTTLEKSKA